MTETRDPDPTNPPGVATAMKLSPVESFRWTTHEERAGTARTNELLRQVIQELMAIKEILNGEGSK